MLEGKELVEINDLIRQPNVTPSQADTTTVKVGNLNLTAKEKKKRTVQKPLDYFEAFLSSESAAILVNLRAALRAKAYDKVEHWATKASEANNFLVQTARDFADHEFAATLSYLETHRHHAQGEHGCRRSALTHAHDH